MIKATIATSAYLLSLTLFSEQAHGAAIAGDAPFGTRCGSDWGNAAGKCGDVCLVADDCSPGEFCYGGLNPSACGNNPTFPSIPSPSPPVTPRSLINNPNRRISYLTSWGNELESANKITEASLADGYLLGFGQWNANGEILGSDGILNEPVYNPTIMPVSYLTWTNLKHNSGASILLALGGETYQDLWKYMDDALTRAAIANNLVELLAKTFPVYKRFASVAELAGDCQKLYNDGSCDMRAYQIVGHVSLDGLDFDYETSARLTPEQNANLELIIDLIRNQIGFGSKVLCLTTYHVAADPVSCSSDNVLEGCSYIENGRSAHHGEALDLLSSAKYKFDFFNVMAYDAGTNFLYGVALENYGDAIENKAKVVLGNTINPQWSSTGTFVETRENNLQRVSYQKNNGFGGFFSWTLGANLQSPRLILDEQLDYFNAMATLA